MTALDRVVALPPAGDIINLRAAVGLALKRQPLRILYSPPGLTEIKGKMRKKKKSLLGLLSMNIRAIFRLYKPNGTLKNENFQKATKKADQYRIADSDKYSTKELGKAVKSQKKSRCRCKGYL